MRFTVPLVTAIIVVILSLNTSGASPRVEEDKVQSVQHFTKVRTKFIEEAQLALMFRMPQLPPPRMVRRLLRKLKRDDDLEAIVEFTYILMKIYFTERPDFIQKAVRLGQFMSCLISYCEFMQKLSQNHSFPCMHRWL